MGKHFRTLETIPSFLLLMLFLGCMLAVLLSGARVYQNISTNLEQQFGTTTCISYITAKARHYDTTDGISTEKLGDTEALAFWEIIDNEPYVTYLYCHEGSLKELFCAGSMDFDPQSGATIMPMEQLDFQLEDGLLTFSCTVDGHTAASSVDLQCPVSGGML